MSVCPSWKRELVACSHFTGTAGKAAWGCVKVLGLLQGRFICRF